MPGEGVRHMNEKNIEEYVRKYNEGDAEAGETDGGNAGGISGESAEREIPVPATSAGHAAGPGPPGRHDPVAWFLEQVESYLEETGTGSSTFGIRAGGDRSLVPALRRGRVCRLLLADRVLELMGREPLGPGFRREVEAYLEVTRTKPYLFGRMAMSNPTFLSELRQGVDMNLETVGRVRRWMDENSSAAERERIRDLVQAGADGGDGGMAADGDEWMDMTEVASLLGFSSRTLHRYLEEGGGPPCRCIGARVLYRRIDVMAWIEAHRVGSGGRSPEDGN